MPLVDPGEEFLETGQEGHEAFSWGAFVASAEVAGGEGLGVFEVIPPGPAD